MPLYICVYRTQWYSHQPGGSVQGHAHGAAGRHDITRNNFGDVGSQLAGGVLAANGMCLALKTNGMGDFETLGMTSQSGERKRGEPE